MSEVSGAIEEVESAGLRLVILQHHHGRRAMIFSLSNDFHDAVAAMPREHPRHRMLELLGEAIRRDVHFIARHPTTLFQCMWNTCWWYDCDEAVKHYVEPHDGWSSRNAPWLR